MKSFDYKDSFVAVREYHSGKLPEKLQRTCFCCGKKINDCNATLLINNYKHIPNVLMHSGCFKEWENKTDDLCSDIESSYKQFKQLNDVFGSCTE